MMDGEDVYQTRVADALAAAEAATLPHVRDRHLAAAKSWQTLLDLEIERKRENRSTDRRLDV